MKNFNDLAFKQHKVFSDGTQAEMHFDNGYGVSVITGESAYTSVAGPYEVAVLKTGKGLCYDSGITDDVMGHLMEQGVTDVMKRIQKLTKLTT